MDLLYLILGGALAFGAWVVFEVARSPNKKELPAALESKKLEKKPTKKPTKKPKKNNRLI